MALEGEVVVEEEVEEELNANMKLGDRHRARPRKVVEVFEVRWGGGELLEERRRLRPR
jgi:hypothetical protein